jgi:hypothetical protein
VLTTIDYRLKEYRQAGFDWFYRAMCATNDVAPELACDRWLADQAGYDFEKRCVLALHQGSTHSGSCEAIFADRFPLMTSDIRELTAFFNENKKRLDFSSDAKHRKRDFPEFLESVGKSIRRFGSLGKLVASCLEADTYTNYEQLQRLVFGEWYACGRMFFWCFAEALYRIADAPIQPPTMEFGRHGPSHTEGWAFSIGRDDLLECNWSQSDITMLDKSAADYLERFRSTFPDLVRADFYTLETACCNYKRGHKGSRYQLCYADEQYDDVVQMMTDWPEHEALGKHYLQARQAVIPDCLLYENHRGDPVNDSPEAYLSSWNGALRDYGRIPRVEAYFNNQPQLWSEPFRPDARSKVRHKNALGYTSQLNLSPLRGR